MEQDTQERTELGQRRREGGRVGGDPDRGENNFSVPFEHSGWMKKGEQV